MLRADDDLLFGILALQNGFIDRTALVSAFHVWSREKSRTLAAILEERGDLSPSRRALLAALAEEHVRREDGDPARSLAALGSDGGVGAALRAIDDEALVTVVVSRLSGVSTGLAEPIINRSIAGWLAAALTNRLTGSER